MTSSAGILLPGLDDLEGLRLDLITEVRDKILLR
jgi:hypothetical protein